MNCVFCQGTGCPMCEHGSEEELLEDRVLLRAFVIEAVANEEKIAPEDVHLIDITLAPTWSQVKTTCGCQLRPFKLTEQLHGTVMSPWGHSPWGSMQVVTMNIRKFSVGPSAHACIRVASGKCGSCGKVYVAIDKRFTLSEGERQRRVEIIEKVFEPLIGGEEE